MPNVSLTQTLPYQISDELFKYSKFGIFKYFVQGILISFPSFKFGASLGYFCQLPGCSRYKIFYCAIFRDIRDFHWSVTITYLLLLSLYHYPIKISSRFFVVSFSLISGSNEVKMPLVRRSVYPTDLCRKQLPENGVNELEMVTNNTLAGVITQLSGTCSILSFSIHSNFFYSRFSQKDFKFRIIFSHILDLLESIFQFLNVRLLLSYFLALLE